jgi:hypothetical protein
MIRNKISFQFILKKIKHGVSVFDITFDIEAEARESTERHLETSKKICVNMPCSTPIDKIIAIRVLILSSKFLINEE